MLNLQNAQPNPPNPSIQPSPSTFQLTTYLLLKVMVQYSCRARLEQLKLEHFAILLLYIATGYKMF